MPTVPPIVIFTDGSCEPGGDGRIEARIGAVVLDGRRGTQCFVGHDVPEDAIGTWGRHGGKQLIAHIEMLAVVAAAIWVGAGASGRRVFFFIDNDGVRASFISYQSRNPDLRAILIRFALANRKWPCFPWFARVPSHANPADEPSRVEANTLTGVPLARRVLLDESLILSAAALSLGSLTRGEGGESVRSAFLL